LNYSQVVKGSRQRGGVGRKKKGGKGPGHLSTVAKKRGGGGEHDWHWVGGKITLQKHT